MAEPLDKKLYNKVVQDAKARFKKWPSAYASGWVVRQYKLLGGRYKEVGGIKPKKTSLRRWFDEKWIDVCRLPKIVPCGREKAYMDKNYPYCRPMIKVSKKTPKTIDEIPIKELKKRCKKKKANPEIRIIIPQHKSRLL